MNNKWKYVSGISGVNAMLDTMSLKLQSALIPNVTDGVINEIMRTQQLLDVEQPISEVIDRWNNVYSSVDMLGLAKSLRIVSERIKPYSMTDISNNLNLQRGFELEPLYTKLNNAAQNLNFDMLSNIIETFSRLNIDTCIVEESVKNNLNTFRDVYWSELINSEDLDSLDIEGSLDGKRTIKERIYIK
ncbi:hypothetical protein [Sedimentibacter sp.]|uniref:hypothetical protein n=1 Tax=Sedimentibacter sp. TaxID=1960295 RepID=UPI0028A8723D|nr:hypothetical protein [Sedimentibacter sp.]